MSGQNRELVPAQPDPSVEVSVIVPARDAAATLGDALASLALQGIELDALEAIVVDDGSRDATAQAVAAASSLLPRLTMLRHDVPRGPAAARNTGLAAAHGRLVTFLDADDWLGPGHLARLVSGLDAIGASFVKCDHVLAEGQRRELRRAPETRRYQRLDPRESIAPAGVATMVDYPNLPTGMYSRGLLEAGLLWLTETIATAEDRAWTWRLHLEAPSYAVVDSAGMFYRRGNPRSLTGAFDQRRLGYLDAARYVAALLDRDPDGERFLPKLVDQTLALTGFHWLRRRQMGGDLRRRFVAEAAGVLGDLPAEVVAERFAALPRYRAQLLAPVRRAYRRRLRWRA
ncbi:MAG: glycosyltransferase [Bifidobacteriaceae bacterium]|jgi:glycosyltransferase involved in cell wall biosynthesis|nr:glycosyltransferase [Bifidobacteriaceae bacterium]